MPFRILGEPWKTLGGQFGGILGSGPRGQAGVEFLFRDDFITAEAVPLTSPRTAEPGPGTSVITDTGNNLSILAGELTGGGAIGAGDPGLWSTMEARVIGKAVVAQINYTVQRIITGWDRNQAGGRDDCFRFQTAILAVSTIGISLNVGACSVNTDYIAAVIMRSSGMLYFIKGGAFIDWTLIWVGTLTNAQMFAQIAVDGGTGAFTSDFLRVSQLPSPWDTDFGIATDRLAGARSTGDAFVHEADCLIEFEVTVLPAAPNLQVTLREQDVNNHWRIQIPVDGSMIFSEVVGGVPTTRIAVGIGTLVGGERIVVIADGNVYRLYYNNTLAGTYVDPSSFFITETSGRVKLIGAGGSISDIVSWPRTISGVARRALDRVANA